MKPNRRTERRGSSSDGKHTRPLNILYLSSAGEIAGCEISLLRLLRFLNPNRFSPTVLCCQDGKFPDRLNDNGIRHEVIPFVLSFKKSFIPSVISQNIRSLWKVIRRVTDPSVAVVHTNDTMVLKFLFLPILLSRSPVMYHLRNYEWKRLWILRLLLRKRRQSAIAVSQSVREHYRTVVGVPAPNMTVIREAADPEFLRQRRSEKPLRKELSLRTRDQLVGLIARFDIWKGHFTFLKAAERVLQINPNVHFVVVGETLNPGTFPSVVEYQEKVLQFASRPRLARQVHFLGWRDDIPQILSSLDVAVCPSENEPFGLVILEALAARIPLIGSDSGGTPEVIEHGKNGLLFPTGDDGALAECLMRLLRNPILARRLAANGHTTVRRHFTMKQYVHTIETLYERMTA